MSTVQEASYLSHQDHYQQDLTDSRRIEIGKTWFRQDTANYWVHIRMYEGASHLVENPEKTWVTIGDGRYGLDSIILKRKGWQHVLPTDISGTLLEQAKRTQIIDDYSVENAEFLSFRNNQFDYVFCKESYHHFPRPMIALYEMLRVANEAVLLIEPQDTVDSPSLHGKLRRLKRGIKKSFFHGKIRFLKTFNQDNREKNAELTHWNRKNHIDAGRYEDSSNFIYSICPRELEKVALGLNYPMVAFKGLNDCYEAGCEFAAATYKNKIYRRMRIKCWINTLLCQLRIKDYSMLMAIIFKNEPSSLALTRLKANGWRVVDLPRNPYIA